MPADDGFKVLSAVEQKFIRHYIRAGATEDRIAEAERKARINKGQGADMLRRKYKGRFYVQDEIERRKAMVEIEQAKIDARDISRVIQEDDQRERVTLKALEKALASIVGLEPKEHGHLVMEAIKLGLVYTGTIRDGRRERTVPAEASTGADEEENAKPGFYQSIFDAMRKDAAPDQEAVQEPRDLMPATVEVHAPPPKIKLQAPAPKPAPASTPAAKKAGFRVTFE